MADTPRYFVAVAGKGGERYVWRPSPALRKLGFSQVPLDRDRATALRQAEKLTAEADASKTEAAILQGLGGTPDTLRALIAAYLQSDEFLELRDATKRGYRQCADLLRASPLGNARLPAITPPVVAALKRSMAARPWQANATLRVLRLVWAWGRREGYCTGDNPASAFRGHKTPARQVVWSHAEEQRFLESASGELRIAYFLAVYTAQREGDLLAMPWSAWDGARIQARQSKTGELVSIPATAALRAALEQTRRRATTILTSPSGQPWKADHFRHVFARAVAAAGLRDRRFMDLRRTAIVRLGEAGCTVAEIAAISGHSIETTARILETYLPRNATMASAAIVKLERRQASTRRRD
jgi:hypothetical protein